MASLEAQIRKSPSPASLRRREQAVAAAGELFLKFGYEGTSVEDIADRAGITVPTLYNYFGSKYHLLVLVVESTLKTIADQRAASPYPNSRKPSSFLVETQLRVIMPILEALNSELWDAYYSNVDQRHGEKRAERMIDAFFTTLVFDCLEEMKRQELIRQDVDIRVFAEIIDRLTTSIYRTQARERDISQKSVRAQLKRLVGPIADLIA